MEKKTIGQFIAALRKAHGMTQKELAEQLNVSDKAVSRWERDESAPDLSLIPVLAEIFGVTSDEILRGERVTYAQNTTTGPSEKGKKQIASLLNRSKTKFQMNSIIAMGIAGIGLIGAMIANLGFLRAYVGFFIGCIFYLGAIVYEFVFLLMTMSSIQIEEVESKDLVESRTSIVRWFVRTIVGILCLFAFTLPLVLSVQDAYWGLNFEYWLKEGFVAAGVTLFIGVVVELLLPRILKDTGLYELSEKQVKSNQLKVKYIKGVVVTLLITFAIQAVFNNIIEPSMLVQGNVFETYADFKAFMETRSYDQNGDFVVEQIVYDENGYETFYDAESSEVYYDIYGNEISEDDMYRETLQDADGNVVLEYIERNQTVAQIEYGNEDGLLPITVYTHADLRMGNGIIELINIIFFVIYILEIVVGIVLYSHKKRHA